MLAKWYMFMHKKVVTDIKLFLDFDFNYGYLRFNYDYQMKYMAIL